MKKKVLAVFAAAVLLWGLVGVIDYQRAQSFELPIFCVGTNLGDDGGLGHYVGLGYSFDIKGNFMPEDEFPGVTKWTYYIFGIEIQTLVRD